MMCCWVSSVLTLEPPFFFTIILAYCTLEWIACCPGCIHKYGRQTRALHIYVRLGVSCSQSDPPIRKYIAFFFFILVYLSTKKKTNLLYLGFCRRAVDRPSDISQEVSKVKSRVRRCSTVHTNMFRRHTLHTTNRRGSPQVYIVHWPPHFPDLLYSFNHLDRVLYIHSKRV